MTQPIKFQLSEKNGFHSEVRKRVYRYFEEKGVSPFANGKMIFKSVFFSLTFLLLYGLILFGQLSGPWLLLLVILLGVNTACLLMNIGHDALHQAYSRNPKLNRLLGYVLDILGSNSYMWSIKHNIVHHSHTNIDHYDEDLDIAPGLIRIRENDPWNPWIRYQHYYAFLLYGLGPHLRVFRQDYFKFFKHKIGYLDNSKHPPIEYFNLFFFKLLYFFLFLGIPILVLPLPVWLIIAGFFIMLFVEGIVLGFIFQLTHYVDNVEVIDEPEGAELEGTWAAFQMRTTSNFAVHNPVINFISGGLNYQIEHHLFPQICHTHYPALAGIVRDTAMEFGVPYIENTRFRDAIRAHLRLLRTMSHPPSTMLSSE